MQEDNRISGRCFAGRPLVEGQLHGVGRMGREQSLEH